MNGEPHDLIFLLWALPTLHSQLFHPPAACFKLFYIKMYMLIGRIIASDKRNHNYDLPIASGNKLNFAECSLKSMPVWTFAHRQLF